MDMANPPPSGAGRTPGLDQISTRWPSLEDPVQFVMRYARAIRKYLHALLKDEDAAEEVAQDFVLRGLLHGFVRSAPLRGRFRHYLKRAVRNAALNHLQRGRKLRQGGPDPDRLAAEDEGDRSEDLAWVAEWRRCALD